MNGAGVRVCHVITRLDLGGAQDNTLHTVASLAAPFRASLVCGRGGMLDAEAARIADLDLTFVDDLVRPISPLRDARAVRRLVHVLRRLRPHIVHTHSSKAGILGRLAARIAGVPVRVHSIHGFGFNDTQPALLRTALINAERALAPLTTHFIAVSRANLDQGARLGIVPRDRSSVIHSGIRLDRFGSERGKPESRNGHGLRRELGWRDDAPLVGMVACLKPQKAPLDFVEVAARVAALRPETRFVMVGDGELRGRVEERAAAAGLGDRLRLLGWRRDVPRLMSALDVMVLTSLWEGLPRVLPEAIACGVPIVATGVDGSADILKDQETGIVCRPRDVDSLAAGVGRLLGDRALGARLTEAARACLSEFDIDAMVREQEALYLHLLRRHGLYL